jgi:hypothetical protein
MPWQAMKKTAALVSARALAAAVLSPLAALPANAAPPQTEWEWTDPGTHAWTVPTGVDELILTERLPGRRISRRQNSAGSENEA